MHRPRPPLAAPAPRPIALALLLALASALTACRSSTGAMPPQQTAKPAATGSPDRLAPTDAVALRFSKVDMLISQWDAAQAAGRTGQATQLSGQIGQEVDAGYDEFVVAARGRRSLRLHYLAVSALGFSGRPDATRVLVEQLAVRDSRLVGNALIALKIRADPATALGPVIQHVMSSALEPRRYAPLVIANVLEARRRRGLYVDPAVERQAAHALSGVVADRDPFVRLHATKALGVLRTPGTYELLLIPMRDEHVRIRLAAAAGLERLGDPRGFPEVLSLLSDAPEDMKPIVRDVLVSYGGKLQGSPIPAEEVRRLDISGQAWSRWFNELRERKGLRIDEVRPPPAAAPSPPTPAPCVPPAPRARPRYPTTVPPSWPNTPAPAPGPLPPPAPPPPSFPPAR